MITKSKLISLCANFEQKYYPIRDIEFSDPHDRYMKSAILHTWATLDYVLGNDDPEFENLLNDILNYDFNLE